LPSFDCYAPLLSLPLLAGTRLDSIPAPIPYVQPDPEIAQRWAARIGPRDGKLRVGLVWAGSPANNNDHNRSIAVERLAALATEPNVQFYSLQTGAAAATAGDAPPGMHDFTADLSDFAETAGLIAQLDLVITVDTAVLHLAGAMGKPVWAMIPFSPDWRWLMDRTDSPWYPTLRLFRQRFTGDWDSVIAAIAASLKSQI
jgi:ADP-heptose:LPS heptosyltransferase